jgi:tetratricopeptide (TPR) repeat protein
MKKQIMTSEKNLNQLKKQNTALAGANKGMNQMVAGVPVKFARIAQENRELVKETSEMHYNLGVFYTQNKNFKMAVKEFERALAIDPDNAKSHYNLGYLYAEEFDKHQEAIMHFQRFLEINPAAKEAEAIRTYLLMRQTYGDKPVATTRNTFKG